MNSNSNSNNELMNSPENIESTIETFESFIKSAQSGFNRAYRRYEELSIPTARANIENQASANHYIEQQRRQMEERNELTKSIGNYLRIIERLRKRIISLRRKLEQMRVRKLQENIRKLNMT
jgi:hypothetical protein